MPTVVVVVMVVMMSDSLWIITWTLFVLIVICRQWW